MIKKLFFILFLILEINQLYGMMKPPRDPKRGKQIAEEIDNAKRMKKVENNSFVLNEIKFSLDEVTLLAEILRAIEIEKDFSSKPKENLFLIIEEHFKKYLIKFSGRMLGDIYFVPIINKIKQVFIYYNNILNEN
ncbi:hypothetical protein Mgra_00006557 [Meloidogyne graminicola]|uniref:Uncharacterized protein n=1 Tax=Meloidogyne graminicola TaxID=189291 RepID=A0A8S9ZL62_9BILA|nr:hypothetical protein Mgra_00006557 [Meloidogyne graminicola]